MQHQKNVDISATCVTMAPRFRVNRRRTAMIDLRPIFENVTGASFVTIDTETKPALKGGKSNPHIGRVCKRCYGLNVIVFSNRRTNGYEAIVQRRLAKEGKNPASFTVSERKWGQRIPNLPLVEHLGQQYLEVIALKVGKVEYFLDGKPIDKSAVIGLEDKSEAEQGGLEDKVVIRDFKAESLRAVRIDGVEYKAA